MTVVLPVTRAPPSAARETGWRGHLTALALLSGALLLLFARDAADMARVWIGSSTYNHCLLVLPIIGWLIWQRLPELRRLVPRAWAGGLVLVGAGALLWLLGWAGSLALARHAGLIAMLQGAAVACLGKAAARALAFPIFYAVFLVPAGEEIVPEMQTLTAHMCMALLALVGIPAHLEGVFISTPAGYFEVAEACSGVKFLVAMLAYGALVANVCFRSWRRRALFMAAAVIIPVLANGVRAWATILVASWAGSDFAAGFDHVVYGWIFFAVVIALLMAVGWRFFDRSPRDPWFDPLRLQPAGIAPGSRAMLAAVAATALAVAAVPVVWAWAGDRAGTLPPEIVMPEMPGWSRVGVAAGARPWGPSFRGADRYALARYRDSAGREVDLAVAVFAAQREGHELVGFGQGPVGPDSAWAWTATGSAPPGGRLDRIASFGTVREVATFYRVGHRLTGSELAVKYETMRIRLFGGPRRAVAVLVSAQAPAQGASPRPTIDDFLDRLGPIAPFADRVAGAN